jgi:hypothetical protein
MQLLSLTRVVALATLGFLCACATDRTPLHTSEAIGRVVGSSIHSVSRDKAGIDGGILASTSKGTIFVPMVRLPRTHTAYIYVIELNDGLLIQAMSARAFNLRDCVRLWHGTDLSAVTSDANFVQGSLESANRCLR